MRIAINALLLSQSQTYRSGGISRYIHALLQYLPEAAAGDALTVFAPFEAPPDLPHLTASTAWRQVPGAEKPVKRILWEQTRMPARLAKDRPDLLHATAYVLPLAWRGKSVVTIMDLSFLIYPQSFHQVNRIYLAAMTHLSARKASGLIAISQHTARDINRLLRVPIERIAVTYCGVDPLFRPLRGTEELRAFVEDRRLPQPFILYLGTLEPRKNVTTLVRAYARLRSQGAIPHKLVLAGAPGWKYQEVFSAIRELDLGADILMPGYIPYHETPLWYNAADLFAYPSLYEGFGLPPLEAMACETPVVASNTSSLPEVLGEAVVTVDPYSVEDLAQALGELAASQSRRQELAKLGPTQASRFSWSRMARETAAFYHKVGGRP